ncbi:hypothetical protein CHS0354_040534 [Potamilus streckersoni]|uniref:Uncharacterized protein n=1 Tax=Potamilus streckersoni TaxID=2493646 RepID=A0AAE0T2D2_9BIVA|nr:hypothetical protein CHS0354_040534 [Potamilus streckersoni]
MVQAHICKGQVVLQLACPGNLVRFCDILGSLGFHVGVLFVDTDGCTGVFGSNRTNGYFLQSGIKDNFASQIQGEKAIGKCQVPYKLTKEGKYKVEVKSLPSGVKFRSTCTFFNTSKN